MSAAILKNTTTNNNLAAAANDDEWANEFPLPGEEKKKATAAKVAPAVAAPASSRVAAPAPASSRSEDVLQGFDEVQVFESFDDMGLKEQLLRGIFAYGFEKPSAIQQRAIVPSMSGRDMYIQAQAGTGKTGAFAISILQNIDEASGDVQAMVLSPTRELALQNTNVITILGDFLRVNVKSLVGGVGSVGEDIRGLRNGDVQVVCGTPGRMLHMILEGHLDTSAIRMLVIDEADEMLNQGFREQIYDIFTKLPSDVQTLLVSATMPTEFVSSSKFMRDPVRLFIKPEEVKLSAIRQYYVDCGDDRNKPDVIIDLYSAISVTQSIIFTNTTRMAHMLANRLTSDDHSVGVITGDLEQRERIQVLKRFKAGQTRVLVATNVLSRGIDVQQVGLVINYDMPSENESYIHRIGRCGRYGRRGVAINLVTQRDAPRLRSLEQFYAVIIDELPANFALDI